MTVGKYFDEDEDLEETNDTDDIDNNDNSEMSLFIDSYTNFETIELSLDNKWKILIIDDDNSIFAKLKIFLETIIYELRGIEVLYANNFTKAQEILKKEEDICIVFLGLNIGSEDAGIGILKYIREDLANRIMRINLSTDRILSEKEKSFIEEYDINGYLQKNEITNDKIHIITLNLLRGFMDLEYLSQTRKTMQKFINTTSEFFKRCSLYDFQLVILEQLCSLMSRYKSNLKEDIKGFIAMQVEGDYIVDVSSKNYKNINKTNISQILDEKEIKILLEAKNNPNIAIYKENMLMYYFSSCREQGKLIFLKKKSFFTGIQKELFELFMNQACMAFNNLSLRFDIQAVQKEMLYKLGEIVELRSKETSYHVKRVSEYTALLGEKYGLEKNECDILRLAASLHDVGKIVIPDLILNKPAKLTEKEFAIVKSHSIIGYEMLKNSNSEVMKVAAIIALQHHERYDGYGYPNGLKGEEIHIYARMVAIADVFDALETRRVYKPAWDVKEILWMFERERGKRFDDKLVQILFENLHEFIKISYSMKDD